MTLLETPFYVALLAFILGMINLGLFVYTHYFLPKSKLTIVFSTIAITASAWQIGEGFLRTNVDIELAYRITLIINSSALLMVTSCFHFSLLFTKNLKIRLFSN